MAASYRQLPKECCYGDAKRHTKRLLYGCQVQQYQLHVKGCRPTQHPPLGQCYQLTRDRETACSSSTHPQSLSAAPRIEVAKGITQKQPKVWFELQVSPLEQLEHLELLASSGFSHPHLNSHTPDQVPHSFAAASANGHDSSQPEPTRQAAPGQQHVHDVPQQSRGSEQMEGEGEGGCAGDIHAVGRLMVQLFRGRMLHHRTTDDRQVGI